MTTSSRSAAVSWSPLSHPAWQQAPATIEAVPKQPLLMVIGGPNGAGKTTLSARMTAVWGLTYLGADQIAAQQELFSTGPDAIRAARLFSRRVGEVLSTSGADTHRVDPLRVSTLAFGA